MPSGRTTLKVDPPSTARPVASSTVTELVVAETIRPPLLSPLRTGSAISIIWPGLTMLQHQQK